MHLLNKLVLLTSIIALIILVIYWLLRKSKLDCKVNSKIGKEKGNSDLKKVKIAKLNTCSYYIQENSENNETCACGQSLSHIRTDLSHNHTCETHNHQCSHENHYCSKEISQFTPKYRSIWVFLAIITIFACFWWVFKH